MCNNGTTTANAAFEGAMEYCEQGLPITLCGGGEGKRPLGNGWDRNGDSMGVDWLNYVWQPETIERAFSNRPGLNVGLKLGPVSGIVDIEADSAEEDRLFGELFAGCESPACPTFQSSRGKHRLYKWDARFDALGKAVVKFKGSSKSETIGIRTGGGGLSAQSVIPPSTGRTWLMSLDECAPPALPEKVIERILATGGKSDPSPLVCQGDASEQAVLGRARKYVATMPEAISGQGGHDATYKVACKLVLGFSMSKDDAMIVLREWNDGCQPPWTEAELQHKIDGADNETGERGYLLGDTRVQLKSRQVAATLSPARSFHCTDMGNGERFAAQHVNAT